MLVKEHFTDEESIFAGYVVKNRLGKVIAIGAIPVPSQGIDGFVIMSAKRYWHDKDLVKAVERLTLQKVRGR